MVASRLLFNRRAERTVEVLLKVLLGPSRSQQFSYLNYYPPREKITHTNLAGGTMSDNTFSSLSKKDQKQLKAIGNEYERLVETGHLEFAEVTPELKVKLPGWTQKYLELFDNAGIKYQICRTCLDGSFMFKTDDPIIAYFEHHPKLGVHQWVRPGYHDALPSNEAIAYLATKKPGGLTQEDATNVLELVDDIIDYSQRPNPENN